MQKFYSFFGLLFFLLAGLSTLSQNLSLPNIKKVKRCYTSEVIAEYRKNHPNAETDIQFENWLGQKLKNRTQGALRPATVNYTIPVIFHIIHNGEAVGTFPNLTASLIAQQLLQLNKDFANLANSPYGTATPTSIQFVLAQKDQSNNILAEPGIDRINRNTAGWSDYSNGWNPSYMDGTVKPASIWNANNYYNVWLVPQMNNGVEQLLGYATFPASSTLQGLNNNENASTAGVVILTGTVASAFSPSNCNNDYGKGKTLAHESGHFFGLRHIWGDTNCGDDFCNDTPVHFGANYGEPRHPKSNSCGTSDEMFENYMDYSYDIMLNTFTANQVDRMQTVMLNSPRRLSLAVSNVGAVTVSGTNQISFINCSGIVNLYETGITGSYPRYRDVNLTLNVENVATGPATVNMVTSGTAVNNLNYQLLTPALIFAAGDAFKNVKIRIFDNAEIDGNKTIIVNYSIIGSGVIAGGSSQSVTLNIKDDDQVVVGSTTGSLYSEDFGSSGGAFPTGWLSGSFLNPAGVNSWKVGSNGGLDVTGQALYITNNSISKPLEYTFDNAADAIAVTPKVKTSGYSNATLSFKYKCNGQTNTDIGVLMYSYNNSAFNALTNDLGNLFIYSDNSVAVNSGDIILPDYLQDTAFTIGFRWINDNNTGNNPPFLVDDISVKATPYTVETSVSSSFGFDLRNGTKTNNFKSSNNKVIATITNVSQNISGVTAQVTQAGTGNVSITTETGIFLRTQKVFQISPTVANSSVTYQGTLYFSAAELAVWGADKLNLKILKVKDGVLLNSILTAGNAEIITPTVIEDVANGYISYTGNFTGFSQFMLVSPLATLPVSLISFQATAQQKSIELVWSTAFETNNRGFFIERSTDANNYKQIGWVNGNGNTSSTSTYTHMDNTVLQNINYYYRILQVDFDNRRVNSPIRNARLKAGVEVSISLSPNPAKDYVNLFISGTTNKANIELINASGQKLLQRNDVNASNGIYYLPLSGLSKGVFNIIIYLPEGTYTKKIVIQ